MVNIIPFRGYRYNKEKIDDIGKVMSPPYDSISDAEKLALYELHENNSVRLVLGMNYPGDTEEDNCYTRAATIMQEWIDEDILIRDPENAIYMYEQAITINGTDYANKGFVALLELEDSSKGNIMPCEETQPSSLKDRYSLLKQTNANISMINCMYVEHDKVLANMMNELSEESPDMEFTTPEGIRQRVWVISYQPTIQFIIQNIKDTRLYITDGQNRYDTCLEYQKYKKAQNPNHTGNEKYNYIMTLLTNAHDDGLVQLPVHRMITCPKGFKEEYFVAGVQDHFKIEKIIVDASVEELVDTMKKQIATPRKENRIALYCGGNYFYRITLKDFDYLKTILPDKSDAYRSLDVTVLNHLLLDELLNINETNYHERVTFTKNPIKGVTKVQEHEFSCIFLINATKSGQISAVATAGEKMPERSISIFPKPATGVVFNKLED